MITAAIIGGTGLEDARSAQPPRTEPTPFGPATVSVVQVTAVLQAYYLSRHGVSHNEYPHEVNYRANIAALSQLGVTHILATNAVGSLRPELVPGTMVAFSDFIDCTVHRLPTLFDRDVPRFSNTRHVDMSTPYCPACRNALLCAGEALGHTVRSNCVYVCVDGPRYETPAEIRMYKQWGGDVVGMTGLPEAIFAREAGLCYAALGIVTNLGAGLGSVPISHGEVSRNMETMGAQVRNTVLRAVQDLDGSKGCTCEVAGISG